MEMAGFRADCPTEFRVPWSRRPGAHMAAACRRRYATAGYDLEGRKYLKI